PSPDPAPAPRTGPRLADGLTVWLTGLPSAGKTTIADALARRLLAEGYPVEVLDGDVLRDLLGRDLGFCRADRDENVRRVGFVANLLSRHGVIAVCALVSPYRATRDEVRALHGPRFFEVHVAAPCEVCVHRDVKGLYVRQRAGEITALTGVDDPYEAPLHPELVVPTDQQTVEESVEAVWAALPR
ncbi:MAG: adenylylsulfate kinase, partial [Actinomycetota bacterium]|nr:adenylylsulfate kinase [Actinomycetota bacterium]